MISITISMDDVNGSDWRADGYYFRQSGGKTNCPFDGTLCSKKPFYSVVLNKDTGEREESSKFMRFAYEHQDFPLRVLVRYVGDSKIQNEFCHGNAKSDEKKKQETTCPRKNLQETE